MEDVRAGVRVGEDFDVDALDARVHEPAADALPRADFADVLARQFDPHRLRALRRGPADREQPVRLHQQEHLLVAAGEVQVRVRAQPRAARIHALAAQQIGQVFREFPVQQNRTAFRHHRQLPCRRSECTARPRAPGRIDGVFYRVQRIRARMPQFGWGKAPRIADGSVTGGAKAVCERWSQRWESNPQHPLYESGALPLSHSGSEPYPSSRV